MFPDGGGAGLILSSVDCGWDTRGSLSPGSSGGGRAKEQQQNWLGSRAGAMRAQVEKAQRDRCRQLFG